MATEYQLGCDRCDFMVTTVAPHQIDDGRVLSRRYCGACGEVRESITGAQVTPRGPLGVPLGPRHGQAARLARGLTGRLRAGDQMAATKCPVCGNDTLLVPQVGQEPRCPQCGIGRLSDQSGR